MSLLLYKASMPMMPSGINATYKVATSSSNGKAKMYHSQLAKDFKFEAYYRFKEAKYAIIDQAAINFVAEMDIPLELTIIFYLKSVGKFHASLYKRDIDGGIKATIDVLFDFLSLNDKIIVDLAVKKRVAIEEPHIYLELRTLDNEDIRKDTKEYGEMFVQSV